MIVLTKERLQILIDTINAQPESMKSDFGVADWNALLLAFDRLDSEQVRELRLLYQRMMDYMDRHNTNVLDGALYMDLNGACSSILRDLARG